MYKLFLQGTLVSCCFWIGCQPANMTTEKLNGRWVVIGGERGNGPTEAMNGMYFIFDADNNMTTNFTMSGEEEKCAYELGSGDMGPLTQKSSDEVLYNITAFADTAMTMTSSWHNVDFTFELRKRALQNDAIQETDVPAPAEPDTTATESDEPQ